MRTFIGFILLSLGLLSTLLAATFMIRNLFTYHWERRTDALVFAVAAVLLLIFGALLVTHPADARDVFLGLGAVLVLIGIGGLFLCVYLTVLSPLRLSLAASGHTMFATALVTLILGLLLICASKIITTRPEES